jgi:electron transport complex protein RnfC
MAFSDFIADLKVRWGVHPDGHKTLASGQAIVRMPLPDRLVLPLGQHIGAPARPVVKVGERVLGGQLIAEAPAAVSAPIHAPTSGTVVDIGEYPVPHPAGLAAPAIVIEPDLREETIAFQPLEDPFSVERDEIARRVAAGGIVGMGGATFPAAVKLSLGKRNPVHTLLLNGGECEPYLTCDDRLMREQSAAILDGARLMAYALGASDIVIGIEGNKPEALAGMRLAAAEFPEVVVRSLPARYPMGSEKQLVHFLTGVEVPAGGLSAEVGVVVHNVATAAAVSRLIRTGEPLLRRVVTVSGGAVAKPANVEVALGTLASDVLQFCGGLKGEPARYVMGGPMMGMVLTSVGVPLIKGSSGLLALTAEEINDTDAGPCIRCATCVSACPIGLLPLEMAAHIRSGSPDGAVAIGLKDCIGCGSCSYACPSHIPLSHYFSFAKGTLAAAQRTQLKNEAIKKLTTARQERLEREAREKAEAAARRKAEREAAKARAAEQARAAAQASNTSDSGQGEVTA